MPRQPARKAFYLFPLSSSPPPPSPSLVFMLLCDWIAPSVYLINIMDGIIIWRKLFLKKMQYRAFEDAQNSIWECNSLSELFVCRVIHKSFISVGTVRLIPNFFRLYTYDVGFKLWINFKHWVLYKYNIEYMMSTTNIAWGQVIKNVEQCNYSPRY